MPPPPLAIPPALRRLRIPPDAHGLAWAAIMLVAGLLPTAWIAHTSRQHHLEASRTRMERFSSRVETNLLGQVAALDHLLRSAQGLATLQPDIRRLDWRAFMENQELERHPGLRHVALVRLVQPADLPSFLRTQQRLGNLDRIHAIRTFDPSDPPLLKEAPDHRILTFAEPLVTGSTAHGLDIGTSTHQRLASDASAATGFTVMSGPQVFSWAGSPMTAAAVFRPLYRPGLALDTPAARRQALTGWVSASLNLAPMLDTAARAGGDQIQLRIVDRTEGLNRVLFAPAEGGLEDHPLARIRPIHLLGRSWEAHFLPTPALLQTIGTRNTSFVWTVGGLLSGLSALAAWAIGGAGHRARQLALQLNRSATEALRQMETLVASSPLAVMGWDAKGRIETWNPAAEALFGLSEAQALGRPFSDLPMDPDQRKAFQEAFHAALTGQRPPSLQIQITSTRGPRLCEWAMAPLVDADERPLGVIGLALDMTDRRQHEEALREHHRMESLGLLAGGIAHDFNNLLGILQGSLDALPLEPEVDRHRGRAQEALDRATTLTRQMLAYAGHAPVTSTTQDLAAALTGFLPVLRATLPRRVELQVEPFSGAVDVDIDPIILQQLLTNLATNAAEAIGNRVGWIRFRVGRVTLGSDVPEGLAPGPRLEPGPYAFLELCDNGGGMTSETLTRIFDPFFSTKFTGRGLGLPASLGILRAHGGSLAVTSQPGLGTAFTIFLPISQRPQEAPAPGRDRTRRTILLADDEDMLLELVSEVLEAEGHPVLAARDGEEALDLFHNHRADIGLAILDLTMPRLGGWEAFLALRDQDPDLAVVLSSGFSERDLPRGEGDARPTAFLTKPYRLDDLRKLVRRLMEGEGA